MSRGIRISEKHGVNPSQMKCFWCGEVKGVALFGRMEGRDDPEAPREVCLDYDFCDKCVEQIGEGIVLVEVSTAPLQEGQPPIGKHMAADLYPNGTWCAVKEDAIRRWFDEEKADTIIQHRKVFVEVGFVDTLMKAAEGAESDEQEEE